MEYTITALIVKNKLTGDVLDIQFIDDIYCEICVEYPNDLITKEDILKRFNGSYERAGVYLDKHSKGEMFYDQQEAKDLFSIGNVLVHIESREITEESFFALPLTK